MNPKKSLFFLALCLFILFVIFSYLVARETFTVFDFNTTVRLQNHLPRTLDFPFSVLSLIGTAELTGIVWLVIFIMLLLRRFFLTAFSLMLLPMALITEIFGKAFVYHPGPPHLLYRGVIHFSFPSEYVPVSYSYPSGHVLRSSFLISFLMLYFYFRVPLKHRLVFQLGFIGFLLLMVVSRIYLGEHWTSDVIGGLLIGSSFGIISGITIPKKDHERQ